MRIATWNVNSVTARLPRLLAWLADVGPDIVCLQETKVSDEGFPRSDVESLGYTVAAHGDGRWNGVAILSKVGLDEVRAGFPGDPGYPTSDVVEARAIAATCGGVRVWSVYVPNGREPGHDHYSYKLVWLEALRNAIASDDVGGARPFAVMGDFNVAPTDDDVWDPAAFVGSTHVTPPERAALAALRDLGLRDIVPRPLKYDRPFTYWDYRAGNFHKNLGMRIDLVYANSAFADAVTDAYIDREARKGTGPSDHAPVVLDCALP
jgi:exodeoxyribonuclease-3